MHLRAHFLLLGRQIQIFGALWPQRVARTGEINLEATAIARPPGSGTAIKKRVGRPTASGGKRGPGRPPKKQVQIEVRLQRFCQKQERVMMSHARPRGSPWKTTREAYGRGSLDYGFPPSPSAHGKLGNDVRAFHIRTAPTKIGGRHTGQDGRFVSGLSNCR